MTARVAYSKNLMVSFTPRGKQTGNHMRGFVRLNGKTVSGWVYDGVAEKVFFAEGVHNRLAYDLARENREQWVKEFSLKEVKEFSRKEVAFMLHMVQSMKQIGG